MTITGTAKAVAAGAAIIAAAPALAAQPVNIDNFIRAETDFHMKSAVDQGCFGKLCHSRGPVPVDRQTVTLTNQDHCIKQMSCTPGPVPMTEAMLGSRHAHVMARTFMDPNDAMDRKAGAALQAVSVNNVTARASKDGSTTTRFGGDPGAPSFLNIMPGWTHLARLYRPRAAALDGSWSVPKPVPVS
jgi:hypothetical protein